jgi:hypothetical protein
MPNHNGEMAEWFKAVDCKSIEFLIVGSNPTFSLKSSLFISYIFEIWRSW